MDAFDANPRAPTPSEALIPPTPSEALIPPTPSEALILGWSIIPCDRNKKPRVRWKSFQDCRPTPKEVEEWSLRNPATWAFVTGQISERITLDFDGDPGRQALKKLGLTPHRRTPSGGYHVDFLHPGWYVPTLNSKSKRELGKRWPGVDIRGDGGYAIFSGRTDRGEYRWLRDPQPEALDILPKELREFLGLLHPPAGTQVPWPNGDLHLAPERRRVNTERLIRTALDKAASEGRNNAGFWLATQLRDNNYAQNEAQAICQEYAARCPATNAKGHIEPYNSDEVRATVRQVYSQPAREAWRVKTTPARRARRQSQHGPENREYVGESASSPAPDLLGYLHNDHGNACRLIALHGDNLRFCYPFKKWLVWDGRRWAVDDSGHTRLLAKRTMLEFLRQGVDKRARDTEKFACGSLDARRITSLLSMAECEIFVRPEELDVDPYLLNFLSGTVDLRTGALRPHQRDDYVTKLIHYDFRPDAPCPLWHSFLDDITGGGPDADETARDRAQRFKAYLQRALGYSLTGCTVEKVVFVPFGVANGKTTLLSTFGQIIEEYTAMLQADTLMTREESNNSQADLADLRGARFVQTSETEDGQRLAQGRLKRITQGMGKIKAVRKYENPIQFKETHKLWMDTNRKPPIPDADDVATCNRLHPIPFTVCIPADRIDKNLQAKLLAEAEGILAWACEGAKFWHESGLSRPPEVEEALTEWRGEADQLAHFLEERCVFGDGFTAQASLLFGSYKQWCADNGERTMITARTLRTKLVEKGFAFSHREKGTVYHRIGLRFEGRSDG